MSSQSGYWTWDDRRKDFFHPHRNPSTGNYEYQWAKDSSAPRTGGLPIATSPAYSTAPRQDPPSQPAPHLPPPQPMEGFSYGARHPSNGGQSYVYSAAPSLSNLDALTRDFAHLGTSSGYESYPQGPPRTSSLPQAPLRSSSVSYEPATRSSRGRDQPIVYQETRPRGYSTTQRQIGSSLTSYGAASASTPESSRAAGKRPAQDYIDAQTFAGSYNEPGPSFGSRQLNVPNYKGGKLDPRDFYVRSSPHKFFVEGRVFIKLHTEDAGHTVGDHSSFGFSVVSYGELAYSQLRRFVVIKAKPRENYCLCIPILTYSGKGAGKKGVDQKAHAIIYTGSQPPEKLSTEVGMNKSPIRVLPCRADEKLDPVSRVNMGKMFTVEWNTKVKDIGQVEKASLVKLLTYWKQIIDT